MGEWNESTVARLRVFWAEGLSAAKIGKQLNISKNAIVGKAHRLNLPLRPSPIRREADGAPKVAKCLRVNGPTLQPFSFEVADENSDAGAVPATSTLAVIDIARFRKADAEAKPYKPPPAVSRPCCWPIGEPRAEGFRYCEAAGLPGRPYCAEHHAKAYVNIHDRRLSAARVGDGVL